MIFKRPFRIPPAEPIPHVRDIVKLIDVSKYPHITPRQISEVVTWIIKETKISRNFGLIFDNSTLYKEIFFFLDFINEFKGIAAIKKIFDEHDQYFYNQFYLALGKVQFGQFEKESTYFFKRLSKTHETFAPNAFDCHLASCRDSVLRNINNYKLDKTP